MGQKINRNSDKNSVERSLTHAADEPTAAARCDELTSLREWIGARFPTRADFELMVDVVRGELSCPDLAMECDRTTAWRRVKRLLRRIRIQVESDPVPSAILA